MNIYAELKEVNYESIRYAHSPSCQKFKPHVVLKLLPDRTIYCHGECIILPEVVRYADHKRYMLLRGIEIRDLTIDIVKQVQTMVCSSIMPTIRTGNGATTVLWRHNEHDGVSNLQPRDCLLNHVFMRVSKKTSNLRVTCLCAGNSPVTGEFPAQRASNAENLIIWWRHHDMVAPVLV